MMLSIGKDKKNSSRKDKLLQQDLVIPGFYQKYNNIYIVIYNNQWTIVF